MPKPIASDYPKHQRWRFAQRSLSDNELVLFSKAISESDFKELDESLSNLLHFLRPTTTDIAILKQDFWLKLWVNIMHQMGLGYTVYSTTNSKTYVMATDLGRFVSETKNIRAYYYYWALRFQFPFSYPKHNHYITNGVAIQPVVLICQYLEKLYEETNEIEKAFLSKYEIAKFLMRSTNHSEAEIQSNCRSIVDNRVAGYEYDNERNDSGFEKTANHFFSRGRLFIEKFDLFEFREDSVLVSNERIFSKIKTFLSYRTPPVIFERNDRDIRNSYFRRVYCDFELSPETLVDKIEGESLQPIARARLVVNPEDTEGSFISVTRPQRKFQAGLRNDMITLYNEKCCICGLDMREFLRASHIVPVGLDKSIAADRRNCLLLCLLHDRAFERGYISLRDDYTIVVKGNFKHPVLVREIADREGQSIQLPENHDFRPLTEYLERHRKIHGIED